MDFDTVESRRIAPDRSRDERLDDLVHLCGRHRPRPGLGVIGGSKGGRTDELSRRAASRVMQLDDGHTAVRADTRSKSGEAREMVVAETPELSFEAQTARVDVAGARHGHTEPAGGAHREPPLLGSRERPVGIALLIGQRGQHESVLHGRSVGESDGIKRC